MSTDSTFPELKQLIFCDIDNTLIGTDKEFDSELPKLVAKARDLDIGFTLATGRVFASARRFAELLELDLPLITNSGAFVSDPAGDSVYRELQLPREVTLELLADTEEVPALRYLHVGGDIYAENPHSESQRYSDILQVPFEYVGELDSWLRSTERAPVVLVVRFSRDEEGLEAARTFAARSQQRYEGELSVLRTLPHLVEFLHPEASKGQALALVAELLEVPVENTVALGDSQGDIDMLQDAGEGILVRNAPRELWPCADRVTEGSSAEGVKEVLKELTA